MTDAELYKPGLHFTTLKYSFISGTLIKSETKIRNRVKG